MANSASSARVLAAEAASALRRRLTPFRTGWNPVPYSYYSGVRVEELIEQLLLPSLGKVAREIFLDAVADERRQFIKNLAVDLLA